MKRYLRYFFYVILSGCTYLGLIGLIIALKKPICIDSTIVNKIDIESSEASILSCSRSFKKKSISGVEYDVKTESYVKNLETQVKKVQLFLSSIAPYKKPVQIKIYKSRPLIFKVTAESIDIGEDLVKLKHHFQRALLKSWVLQHKKDLTVETLLYNEIMIDFLYYTMKGILDFENPIYSVKTRLTPTIRWPQIIKSETIYCRSAWIFPEDLESCKQKNSIEEGRLSAEVLSLRPLLTSAWLNSFHDLTYKNQQNFLRRTPYFLSEIYLTPEQALKSLFKSEDPLYVGLQQINKFSHLVASLSKVDEQSEVHDLYTYMNHKFLSYGVTDSYAEAQFDYIIEFDGVLNPSSLFFKAIEKATMNQKDKQVAIMDSKSMWILPSQTALPLRVFDRLQAYYALSFVCMCDKQIPLENYFDRVEKVVLINDCGDSDNYEFKPLMTGNLTDFYVANPNLKFIQFHIPSLKMMKEEISYHQNFFELVKLRDMNVRDFKVLGWSEIEWKKESKAFKPKAVVEAIEYFRN